MILKKTFYCFFVKKIQMNSSSSQRMVWHEHMAVWDKVINQQTEDLTSKINMRYTLHTLLGELSGVSLENVLQEKHQIKETGLSSNPKNKPIFEKWLLTLKTVIWINRNIKVDQSPSVETFYNVWVEENKWIGLLLTNFVNRCHFFFWEFLH